MNNSTRPPGSSADLSEEHVDHSGRAKPVYARQSPEPWRPSRTGRVLLGLWPGARVMAMGRTVRGLPYAGLGLAVLVALLWLVASFSRTEARLEALNAQPRFLLFHAFAIFIMVLAYELLRFGAVCEETRRTSSRMPRFLAAFVLPGTLILAMGPALMQFEPRWVEPAWFASAVVVLGGTPAAAWCTFEALLLTRERQRRFRLASAGVLLGGTLLFGFIALTGIASSWSGGLKEAGFVVLPALLGRS